MSDEKHRGISNANSRKEKAKKRIVPIHARARLSHQALQELMSQQKRHTKMTTNRQKPKPKDAEAKHAQSREVEQEVKHDESATKLHPINTNEIDNIQSIQTTKMMRKQIYHFYSIENRK